MFEFMLFYKEYYLVIVSERAMSVITEGLKSNPFEIVLSFITQEQKIDFIKVTKSQLAGKEVIKGEVYSAKNGLYITPMLAEDNSKILGVSTDTECMAGSLHHELN